MLCGQAITEGICRYCGKEAVWANTDTSKPCYDCMDLRKKEAQARKPLQ